MSLKRSEKEVVVKGIGDRFRVATSMIVTEYAGLKVSEMTELRREIRKVDGELHVLKNRLVKRALMDTEMKVLADYLKGPTAIAFSHGDPVALSKVIAKYVESLEKLKLKGGFLGGKLLAAKDVQQIAKLPSKEELYAKLLGTLQAPIQGVLRTLQGVPQKLVLALNEIKNKKEA